MAKDFDATFLSLMSFACHLPSYEKMAKDGGCYYFLGEIWVYIEHTQTNTQCTSSVFACIKFLSFIHPKSAYTSIKYLKRPFMPLLQWETSQIGG